MSIKKEQNSLNKEVFIQLIVVLLNAFLYFNQFSIHVNAFPSYLLRG